MLTYQAMVGLAHSGSQRLLLSLYPYYRPPYDERSRQDHDGPGHPETVAFAPGKAPEDVCCLVEYTKTTGCSLDQGKRIL